MRKDERIKADIIVPNAHSGRFPAMSAVARTPNPGKDMQTRNRKHVQYCVNKIETQNKKPIVSSDYPA